MIIYNPRGNHVHLHPRACRLAGRHPYAGPLDRHPDGQNREEGQQEHPSQRRRIHLALRCHIHRSPDLLPLRNLRGNRLLHRLRDRVEGHDQVQRTSVAVQLGSPRALEQRSQTQGEVVAQPEDQHVAGSVLGQVQVPLDSRSADRTVGKGLWCTDRSVDW